MQVCMATTAATRAAIVKVVSLVRVDPSSTCLAAIGCYVKLVATILPVPFSYYYSNASSVDSKEGMPMLRPTQGFRKLLTMFIQAIVLCRAGWLLLALHGNVKVTHQGMLTSDFCFVATIYLTAATVIAVWFKTLKFTDVFCWLHNSYCQINWSFSGTQIFHCNSQYSCPVQITISSNNHCERRVFAERFCGVRNILQVDEAKGSVMTVMFAVILPAVFTPVYNLPLLIMQRNSPFLLCFYLNEWENSDRGSIWNHSTFYFILLGLDCVWLYMVLTFIVFLSIIALNIITGIPLILQTLR